MDEKERNLEEQIQSAPETDDFNLEDIMKEFAPEEDVSAEEVEQTLRQVFPEESPEEPEEALEEQQPVGDETLRMELPVREKPKMDMGDTIRLGGINLPQTEPESKKEEPFTEKWQPEFEQPMGEYVPPQPIIFHPRSRLRELKRKLVAGPERRYYEINELGVGKLQFAIFLNILVVLLSAGATVLYAAGMGQESRLKLMVFGQFLAMLISALLGSYQLIEGISDLFKGRFSFNTLLVFTLIACTADGIFCLGEQRIPCCAAFCLQVTMSLFGAYHRRTTEMAMMDTLRKANHLHNIVRTPDYYDGCAGLLRQEGEVEDFMDNYSAQSTPEKVFSWYAVVALLMSLGIGVVAGVLHHSVSFGVQVLSVSLLAAVPVTSFIALTRPMAVLERRLHKLGAVLCGWQGISALNGRAVFPISHEDLFPVGACKLNGVKFYGDRDPDEVIAYCNALVEADGGGLVPLFAYLLSSRSGRHYKAENVRTYGNGGMGAEVCGEPVLMGTLAFLKALGVEIPEGISVNQAVYAAIDGELCGVFAVTYAKMKLATTGLRTLCAYNGLQPMLVSYDFMLTEEFIRSRFAVNTRRMSFPERSVKADLMEKKADTQACSAALITTEGLAPYAFAVTGARSLRTAWWTGVAIHLLGGILGLAMMLTLAIFGAGELLTPANLFLYELVWIVPGLLITEWTRSV